MSWRILGQVVLVNLKTRGLRAEDILEPYAYWELKPATIHATRMSNMEERTREQGRA